MFRAFLALVTCAVVSCQEVPNEDNMRFLQPYLDHKALGDGIEAYDVGHGVVLVPLGEISRLLGFGIKVNVDRTVASGVFITKRTFSLDLNKNTFEVDGHKVTMPRVVKMPLDIYVDAKALGEWFPLEISIYLEDSAFMLKSKEKLPIQEQWEQQGKYGKNMSSYGVDEETTHGVYRPTPYSFIGMPMVDLNLGLSHSSKPSTNSNTENATIGGDLFWMSSDVFANRDTNGSWNNSRVTLFREDPTGELLGPLHAKNIEMGDLFNAPSMDLVGSLPQGRGLDVNNFPVTYRTRFSTKTFRGSLAPGWSVEIFQNDTVIGFQQSRVDGLYEFKDVPLRFGVNTFKLVFHGPLGERISRTYRLDISQAQPPPGTFYYGVAGVRPKELNQSLDYSISPSNPSPDIKPSYMVQGSYGLSRALSVQGGVTELQLQDGSHTYETMGIRGIGSFMALQLSIAQDHGPSPQTGLAYEGILNTGYGYSTLTLRRDQYKNNFQRSAYETTGLGATGYILKDATGADLNWSAPIFNTPFSISTQIDKEDYVGGASGERKRFLISSQLGQIMLTDSMTSLRLPNNTTPLQGTLTANVYTDRWSWNADLVYTKTVLNGWGLLAQYNTPSSWLYQAGIKAPLGSPTNVGYTGPRQLSAGISKMTGNFGFGFNVQESSSSFSASLNLQISFGREPRTGKWSADAQSLATSGAISAVAFIDIKGTGKYEPGDPIVEGAKVRVGGGETVNQINDPAVTFITKLPKSQAIDVSLDESSLEDPSQKAAIKTVTVTPRYGKVTRVEFAITSVGEVNGTTRLLRDGKRSEVGGLEVELLDSTGKQVREIRSSYDGFYEFTDLPYGDYLLRVTPKEVTRMNIKPAERKIQFKTGHNFLDGVDLIVEAAQ